MIEFLIIGYGNPERRDDGCGRQVAGRLQDLAGQRDDLRIHSVHQLDPAHCEDLAGARVVVFVDATIEDLKRCRRWKKIGPQLGFLPLVTHHLHPSFLLGLACSIWGRCPEAWLVSIKGHDFGFGEGLSPQAKAGVEKVSREIASFLTKTIDKNVKFIKTYAKGKRGELPWPSAQIS